MHDETRITHVQYSKFIIKCKENQSAKYKNQVFHRPVLLCPRGFQKRSYKENV